jgi:CRISPR-associated protein Csx3
MTTYKIEMVGDTLKVGFGNPAQNDQIVLDAITSIKELVDSGQISGGKLLKIFGKQSLPVAYAICHSVAHLYEAIAVYDPKIGGEGYDGYIVSISHSSEYPVGETLKFQNNLKSAPVKIALCGPPHSGKSCLRAGLKIVISELTGQTPYIITACPDGEGAWFYDTMMNDPIKAKELKESNKGEFTIEYAKNIAKEVKNLGLPISIVDCGGLISPENNLILQELTHAVILAGDYIDERGNLVKSHQEFWKEWSQCCDRLNVKVIAKIYSDFYGNEDIVDNKEEHMLTGSVHHLTRDEDTSGRLMVQALANHIITLSVSNSNIIEEQ